ncbi:MAG TPA: hypothetical protein VN580_00350 [Clostridia bacterium]|nr:hypothetical protein [Clostridia bacterium]
MCNKLKMLFFTVLVIVTIAAAVYADTADTGWMGYGLYNLNKSEVSISNESDNVVIDGSNVSAVYEYTIKNNSGKSITVNFGYPDNGITKFSVHDGSKFLTYKTRDTAYLKNNYGVKELQTPDGRWYLFNMTFTSGQTRTIKVSIEAAMKKEGNDTYKLSFFKDRSFSYAIKSQEAALTLKLSDFKPYDIFELDGVKPEEITADGSLKLSYSGDYGSGASLRYQPVDRMVLDKLNGSEYKKPKAIVKAFDAGNFEETMTLCDEYIEAPGDNTLSIEQVKYVRAECMRKLNDNEGYLKALGEINRTVLYPARIGYKITIDSLEAYSSLNNDEGIDNILRELLPDTEKSYPYLHFWLAQSGYELAEVNEAVIQPTGGPAGGKPASGKGLDILGGLIAFMTMLRESKWTYTILGLVIGFVLGRITKRNKRKSSVYLFRD